ncbi:hypothetical protein LSH36_1779g00008 [Paralvinella palmiformis]|uniref:Uncharacterized protein n=1 Tax=Paralvinella palmiformis TaxID=53620 RepID=A0AAD9IR37_9ANNE|nr:hypothetical protein LSH36_1779g00008 [Paralvinella palmiformis]
MGVSRFILALMCYILLGFVFHLKLNTINSLQTVFDEAQSYSKCHPSKGYWWKFKDKEHTEKYLNKDPKKAEEPSSLFQRQQVDLLLGELANKFPPKFQSVTQPEKNRRTSYLNRNLISKLRKLTRKCQ